MGKPKNHKDCLDIAIDSADRDIAVHPNPSDYVVKLPYMIRSVKSIELMSLQMTRTEPAVNTGNNKFKITIDQQQTYNVAIPIGEYVQSTFITALSTALKAINSNLDATVSSATMRLSITYPTQFSIEVGESTARLLGVWGSNTSGRGSGTVSSLLKQPGLYSIEGTRANDLSGVPYLIMYLNDYNRIVSPTNQLNRAYMLIPMETRKFMDRFIITNDEKEKKGKLKLTDGQRSIHQFRVQFTRPDGSPYDFNGVDHHLLLKVSG